MTPHRFLPTSSDRRVALASVAALHSAPLDAHAPGPAAAADGADPAAAPFRQWLDGQVDALMRWCLQQHDRADERADFADQAVAVLRQDGPAALAPWLLWAAIMLARRGQERAAHPQPALAALPIELMRLLHLAVRGRLSSQQVLQLMDQPMSMARLTLARAMTWSPRAH